MSVFFWHRQPKPPHEDVSGAALERYLELSRPGDLAGQLKQLLLLIFLLTRRSPEEITELAWSRWDLRPDKTAELLRGNVEFGFRWYSINGVLTDCGTPQVYIDKARELFHDFSRRDIAPAQLTEALDPARREPEVRDDCGDGAREAYEDHPEEDPKEESAPVTKPDPATATTKEELLALLPAFRLWHGRVSYRRMEKVIDKRYVHSTLAEVPHRDHLPSLDLVLAYIEGCGGKAEDLAAWEAAWRRIAMSEERP